MPKSLCRWCCTLPVPHTQQVSLLVHKRHRISLLFSVKSRVAEQCFSPLYQTVVLFCGGRKGWRGGSVDLRAAFMLIFLAFAWSGVYLCLRAGTHLWLRVLPCKADSLFRMLKRPVYAVAFAPDTLEATSCITYTIAATNRK